MITITSPEVPPANKAVWAQVSPQAASKNSRPKISRISFPTKSQCALIVSAECCKTRLESVVNWKRFVTKGIRLHRVARCPSSNTTWDFLCLGYLLSPFRHARPLISTSHSRHFWTRDPLDTNSSPITLLSPPSTVRRIRILVIPKVLEYDSDVGVDMLLRFSSEEG